MNVHIAKTGKYKIFIIVKFREKPVFTEKLFRTSLCFFVEISHAFLRSSALCAIKKSCLDGKTELMFLQSGAISPNLSFNNLTDISCRLKNCYDNYNIFPADCQQSAGKLVFMFRKIYKETEFITCGRFCNWDSLFFQRANSLSSNPNTLPCRNSRALCSEISQRRRQQPKARQAQEL